MKSNLKLPAAVPTPLPDLRSVRVTDPLNVSLTFQQLTHRTCPHGYEVDLYGEMLADFGFELTEGGYVKHIGNETQKKVMFAAHLDDVSRTVRRVNHKWDKTRTVISSDGKTILGADDKAGVSILLYMAAMGVPGTYYLFFGEEVGCIGSGDVAKTVALGDYTQVVSFDRAGYDDVITHQAGSRTCSDAYAAELARQLNSHVNGFEYEPSNNGVYTDSREFAGKVAECTNISVGYYNQHGFKETQDVRWLEVLAYSAALVDWQALPVERDPSVEDSLYGSWRRGGYWDDDGAWSRSYTPTSTASSSSMLAYYEAKYGTALEEHSMEDMVELLEFVGPDELEGWGYSNVEKLVAFFRIMSTNNPIQANSVATQIDREVK